MRFAIQHKIGSIIPPLLYILATTLRGPDTSGRASHRADYDKMVAQLTGNDLGILLGGSLSFYNQTNARLARMTTIQVSPTCLRPPPARLLHSCITSMANNVRPQYITPGAPPVAYCASYPLDTFDRILKIIPNHADICAECKIVFMQQTTVAKLQLWKDLPRIFNVVSTLSSPTRAIRGLILDRYI